MNVTISVPAAMGWIGMIFLLLAYALNAWEIVGNKSLSYLFLNLGGGTGTAISAYCTTNWPVFALETIWALIAAFQLLSFARYLFRRRD